MTVPNQLAIPNPRPRIDQNVGQLVLYGGAFDPVHNAHLEVAHAALDFLEQAELCFIPAAQSPLKQKAPATSDRQRTTMLELAIREISRCHLDELELRRGGLSYSIDTVRAFRAGFPKCELFWVLGADQFGNLPKWHRVGELAADLTFLVVGRPGHPLATPEVPGLRHERLDLPLMADSSSEIRARCRAGQAITGLVPPQVEAFISENALYTS